MQGQPRPKWLAGIDRNERVKPSKNSVQLISNKIFIILFDFSITSVLITSGFSLCIGVCNMAFRDNYEPPIQSKSFAQVGKTYHTIRFKKLLIA
jgi:hypothetical protein